MKRKKYVIIFAVLIFAAIFAYIRVKTIEINYWPYIDKNSNGYQKRDSYLFKNGMLYKNSVEIGSYSRFINSLQIELHESKKKIKGKVINRMQIELYDQEKTLLLNLSKG